MCKALLLCPRLLRLHIKNPLEKTHLLSYPRVRELEANLSLESPDSGANRLRVCQHLRDCWRLELIPRQLPPHHGRLTDQLLASGAQSARGPARDITWANSGSSSSSRPLARSISFASHGGADPRTSSQTESPAVWLPWHRHTLPWPETQPRSATATQTPPQQVRGPPVLAWDDDQSDAWDPEHHQDVTA